MSCEQTLRLAADGSEITWELGDPALLIQSTLEQSPRLQHVYGEALRESPCSPDRPWNVIIGFDEFTPGKPGPGADNPKKMMCLYFNFLNLGMRALSKTSTWFIPIAVRHDLVVAVDGGWSCMMALFLRRLFLAGSGLATAGVPVLINQQYGLIHARLHILMSDGDGLRSTYLWKGAGSIKPCLKHHNVLKKGSDLANRAEGYVEITCHEPGLFKAATTPDFHLAYDVVAESHRRLAAGEIDPAVVKMIETTTQQACRTILHSEAPTSTYSQLSEKIGCTAPCKMAA